MHTSPGPDTDGIPEPIQQLLQHLVAAAQTSFREDLRSVVLFGSGAEGRLRPTSDLNLLFVLTQFQKERVDAFREPLRVAQVAARASVMFLLENELPAAAEAFAVKFDDITRRHRVLFGENLMARFTSTREARKARVLQMLLNLKLRLRERYAATSLREEQLAIVVAEAAGPLRAAAWTLCELENRPANSPREALETVAAAMDQSRWAHTLALIPQARQTRALPPGAGGAALFDLMQLCEALRQRAETLP